MRGQGLAANCLVVSTSRRRGDHNDDDHNDDGDHNDDDHNDDDGDDDDDDDVEDGDGDGDGDGDNNEDNSTNNNHAVMNRQRRTGAAAAVYRERIVVAGGWDGYQVPSKKKEFSKNREGVMPKADGEECAVLAHMHVHTATHG